MTKLNNVEKYTTPYGDPADDRVAELPDVEDMKRMKINELLDYVPAVKHKQFKDEIIYILQSYY